MIVILQDDRVEVIWSNLFVSTLLSHDVAFFDNDVHVVKAYTTHRTHFPAIWLITAKCGNWGRSIRFVALSVGFFILIEKNLNKLTSAPFPWIFRAGSFVMRYLKRIEKLNQAISCSRCCFVTPHFIVKPSSVLYYFSHMHIKPFICLNPCCLCHPKQQGRRFSFASFHWLKLTILTLF